MLCNSLIINIENQIDIVVSTYSNLQIRTGVYITNPHNIKNTSGPLIKPLNKENYIIPRISFDKIMNMNLNNNNKLGQKIEKFSNNNSDVIKKIDIY